MRNAPGVAPDIDAAEQSLHLRGTGVIGQMIGGINRCGGWGHRALLSSSLLFLRWAIIRMRNSKATPSDRRPDARLRFPAASAVRCGSDRPPAGSAWQTRSRAADPECLEFHL